MMRDRTNIPPEISEISKMKLVPKAADLHDRPLIPKVELVPKTEYRMEGGGKDV
jgi:hypothetical protein